MIDNIPKPAEFYPPHIVNVAEAVYENFFGGDKAIFFSLNEIEKLDIIKSMCALTTAELTERSCPPAELAKHIEFVKAVKEQLRDHIAAVVLPESEIGALDAMPNEHLRTGEHFTDDIYRDLKEKIKTLPNQTRGLS